MVAAEVRTLRLAGLDLVAITVAYLGAVAFRVGGRAEIAVPEQALALALCAAAVQVAGNAALGVYRPGWILRQTRDLATLALPTLAGAVVVLALNLSTGLHGIPFAALPIAALVGFAFLVARRLRRRWRSILRAILGQRELGPVTGASLLEAPDPARATIPSAGSIRDAMQAIDRDVSRIALLVDPEGRLVGTVTDGDARRAILAGISLDSPAAGIMTDRPVVARSYTSDDDVLSLMQEHSIRQVPVVDAADHVLDIKLFDRLGGDAVEDADPVLIMAGGLGRRLGDITRDLPKPLVPVGGKPILATLVEDLAAQGFREIILAVGHRADQIERYFGDGRRFGADVTYVREAEPLGTAGAISLALPRLQREFMVTNADLLTHVNFAELVRFHRVEKHDLTIGIIESTYELRYGLVHTEGTRVTGISEKPELRHFVNGGIYVMQSNVASLVPREAHYDMDELIRAALAEGLYVGCFPIHEFWADIGIPADLKTAAAAFRRRASDPNAS
jgi:dTDP-glucose pyrophosphorylase